MENLEEFGRHRDEDVSGRANKLSQNSLGLCVRHEVIFWSKKNE